MSYSVMVWLASAVLLFWSIGAYNRLMRFRSQSIVAFTALEGLFQQYVVMVKTNYPDAHAAQAGHEASQGYDGSSAAWAGLAAAAEQFSASLKVAHAHPLNGPPMRALQTAHETLWLSWCRLRDLPPDLAGPALPNTFQSQWEHIALPTEVARTEFNRKVMNYNEAIAQFPALLLAWVFGFKPAQPI